MKIEMNYEELESIKKKARDEGYTQGYGAGYAAGLSAHNWNWNWNNPNISTPYYWTASDHTTTGNPVPDTTTISCGPSTASTTISISSNTNENIKDTAFINSSSATTASSNAVTSDNLDEKLREWLKQTIG